MQSPDKQRKMIISKQMSGIPASPGTSRRAAQYGVTLPRKPSKEAIKVPTKPAENTPQSISVPVVNSHNDVTDSHLVISNLLFSFSVVLYLPPVKFVIL